jgi:hypothetical protein
MDHKTIDSIAAPDPEAALRALLRAAARLLEARQDQMVTSEQWADLARAVAVCRGGTAAEYLTAGDIESDGQAVLRPLASHG